MTTKVKTEDEIEAMREGGKMLAKVHQALRDGIEVGMTTMDLEMIARKTLNELDAKPAFLGQYGFPQSLCVSVNDEVVHGIPKESLILKDGDIVSMDYGVIHKGLITDAAFSTVVGQSNKEKDKLLAATERALLAGIDVLADGVRVGDIGAAIQGVLDPYGYGIVRDLVGHGVGHHLHEEPNIPNIGVPGTGPTLKAGMTIAIEPMVNLGTHEVTIDDDGWTVRTADSSLSAHFEHTVLITARGPEILTQL